MTTSHRPASLFTLVVISVCGPAFLTRAEVVLTDDTNAILAVSQVESGGDTTENPDLLATINVGALISYSEAGSNDYGCCGGRDGNYGAHNLNDGDVGEGPASDGLYAIPTTGPAMVVLAFDAGSVTVGGIAIHNGYGNRDDGSYTLRDADGTLIASWTISGTPGGTNNGVDSLYLQFKAPVTTTRLVIDGQVGDCCGTASFREIQVFGPSTDTDNDRIPDAYEIANGLNPSVNDAASDLDGDGLTNLQEYQRGTAANRGDTDEDGLSDAVESNTGAYVSTTDTGTHPLKPDTDNDGLFDGAETRTGIYVSPTNSGSDPFVPDTDADGFADGVEVGAGFNPNTAASTPADTSNIRTAIEFYFYGVPGVSYRIEGSVDMEEWTILEPVVTGTGARIVRFYSTENQPARFFRAVRN
ncbi:MAG: hypothetical protein ACKV19_04385 [Verrucomicrobiales bacterium]